MVRGKIKFGGLGTFSDAAIAAIAISALVVRFISFLWVESVAKRNSAEQAEEKRDGEPEGEAVA